jgi:hypothetical protein
MHGALGRGCGYGMDMLCYAMLCYAMHATTDRNGAQLRRYESSEIKGCQVRCRHGVLKVYTDNDMI